MPESLSWWMATRLTFLLRESFAVENTVIPIGTGVEQTCVWRCHPLRQHGSLLKYFQRVRDIPAYSICIAPLKLPAMLRYILYIVIYLFMVNIAVSYIV